MALLCISAPVYFCVGSCLRWRLGILAGIFIPKTRMKEGELVLIMKGLGGGEGENVKITRKRIGRRVRITRKGRLNSVSLGVYSGQKSHSSRGLLRTEKSYL